MAGFVVAAENLMLDALGDVAVFASLHTADPGTGGTSEVNGGSPAYARKAITWAAAASGAMALSAGVTFDVPASTTVTHVGFWSASTSGTFYGSLALDAPEAFGSQGTLDLDDVDLTLADA
jgi:hypothetical protein